MPHAIKFKADALRTAQLTSAMDNPVYKEIARRLMNCNPPVVLDAHIAKIQRINDTTLDGVSFVARDYKKLKNALIEAKDGAGAPFFAHATLEDHDHWAPPTGTTMKAFARRGGLPAHSPTIRPCPICRHCIARLQ